ncbi:MAG: DUF1552 domain-containing protein [Verrucomicrobia bacterium]|nr:DUF1552 domain-containing protein [Verrucomicrobiota bacterium]
MSHPRLSPSRVASASSALSRRQFLRGVGVCLSLPVFESALSPVLKAAPGAGPATTASGAPLRMAFVYFPNGAHQANWWPTGEGSAFELGATMQPLAPLKSSVQIMGGLDHRNATAGNDGAGDHARANATFLTGARARKTASADIRVGVSVDQIAAQQIGHVTRFPSLELSCDAVRKSGGCDSGYSCAYQYNLSWASAAVPVAPESNPRLVFERLFGAGAPAERQTNFTRRQQTQRSLLDFVLDDARSLQRELGSTDRAKLDEYLTSVREIERRIERTEKFGGLPDPRAETPAGIPSDYGEHMNLMYDLLALAFSTDSTRVATLLLAGDGSNKPFPQIGVAEGHHYCSHHKGQEDLLGKIALIDRYYMERFARFLTKLDQMKDSDGRSVLHNSMIVYGCGNCDGNRHNHDNLPVILAGGGGGTLSPGRYVRHGGVPMSNLFLSMTDRLGVTGLERIGDSSGKLAKV